MKQIILITLVFLMPAAHAVDYVKCEAIQKAYGRLSAARELESDRAWSGYLRAERDSCPMNTKNPEATYQCGKAYRANHRAKYDAQVKEIDKKYKPRLEKARADYAAEGCL
tara:strand:- start:127 stop:459 length:333 start_codon:yes stop_codon:yes gene_type:complete